MSPLVLTPTHGQIIAVATEAKETRDRLLLLALDQKNVTSTEEARYATEVLRSLKSFSAEIEESRKEVKAPLLALSKQIDATAQELTTNIEAQAKRISLNLGNWQQRQQQLQYEAEQKARADQARIEQEARDAIDAAAAKSRTQESFDKKADKIEEKALEQIAETRMAVAAISSQRPEGIALRKTMKYEVTDIVFLYESNPLFVNMTPNNAVITSALKKLTGDQKLPGVNHWMEATVNVR